MADDEPTVLDISNRPPKVKRKHEQQAKRALAQMFREVRKQGHALLDDYLDRGDVMAQLVIDLRNGMGMRIFIRTELPGNGPQPPEPPQQERRIIMPHEQ